MNHSYPVLLDVRDRLIVIIGGGEAALRKAEGVLAAGARQVRAVAPRFNANFPPLVKKISALYQPAHLDGAGLVFAATDCPGINDQIVQEAHRRGILVNRADEHGPGDFATTAALRAGAIIIAVSTGGSPALSASLRDELAINFPEKWHLLAEALLQLRPRLRALQLPSARRQEIHRALATAQAADIATRGIEPLWRWAAAQFPEISSAPPSASQTPLESSQA